MESSDTQPVQAATPAIPPAPEDSNSTFITWTATEFIAHDKSPLWYMVLAIGSIVLAGLIFLATRDFISVAVILMAALLLGIYAGHKPKQLEYRLNATGLDIGPKHFGYNEFRSFSVMQEGQFPSIVFMPLKRFAVPTTIYYSPDNEEKIVNFISDRLPLDARGHDAIDKLLHRIHF